MGFFDQAGGDLQQVIHPSFVTARYVGEWVPSGGAALGIEWVKKVDFVAALGAERRRQPEKLQLDVGDHH